MSTHQEVWITLRIKSQLPVEKEAKEFADEFKGGLLFCALSPNERRFLADARDVEVIEVKEERHIYGTED